MSWPSVSEVENAFQPSREVERAERFAGREGAIKDAYLALLSDGANLAVVGNRGIGKSSLARQIGNMASGDCELLDRLNIDHEGPLDFLHIYFACADSVRSISDLLERLLTTRSCLADWLYDLPTTRKKIETIAPELNAKIFGLGASIAGEKTTAEETTPVLDKHGIETVFANTVSELLEQGVSRNGILLVLDEFDKIKDPLGMAGLMKSAATNMPNLKFCLVGVARDIQNLMKEHESSDRLFAGSIIHLPPMTVAELTEIVRIAESSIGNEITFSNEATQRLVSLAQGHPYMVHLVGKYALREAHANRTKNVEADAINDALKSIAARGADPVLENRFRRAVGASAQREVVLRALATSIDDQGECRTTDAYKIALEEGVDNASQYVGQLVTDEYGAELEKVRERYYRFKDSLFVAYVLAHPRFVATA